MEEIIVVLQKISSTLSEISSKLDGLSNKLDMMNGSGVYGIEDIIKSVENVSKKITGDVGYNLTDIYSQFSDINNSILTS